MGEAVRIISYWFFDCKLKNSLPRMAPLIDADYNRSCGRSSQDHSSPLCAFLTRTGLPLSLLTMQDSLPILKVMRPFPSDDINKKKPTMISVPEKPILRGLTTITESVFRMIAVVAA